MSHWACVRKYGSYVTDRMLCVASSSHYPCFTDLGGPLIVRSADCSYSLAGIFSVGMKCTSSEGVGVFTSLAVVRDWLAEYNVV